MQQNHKRVVIVGGPTASGKTKIALEIAKKSNGELINADSRQIYRFLDIGTNKDTSADIPIHLVNIINPDQRFSVYEFQQLAQKTIDEIISRGKLPILVGGTGLYIDSIFRNYNLQTATASSETTREELETKTLQQLQELLRTKDSALFEKLNNSDKNNPRRLVRLIEKSTEEVTDSANSNIEINKDRPINSIKSKYEFEFLYPEYNWSELKVRIENRVEQMFKDGLVDETKRVLAMGYKKEDPGLQIMGYKQVIQYLEGEFDLETAKKLIKFAHKQYARRQRTWFEGKGRNYNLIKTNIENAYSI